MIRPCRARPTDPARERRLDELWARFVDAWRVFYGDVDDLERFVTTTQRAAAMAGRLRFGRLPGFCVSTRLESADLGLDHIRLDLQRPAAAEYLPGTPEKLALLAARFERGEELWDEEDAERSDD